VAAPGPAAGDGGGARSAGAGPDGHGRGAAGAAGALLALRYLEELPEAQVADMLGCSVGTVRSQTHKAIAQLRLVLPSLGLTSAEAGR